MSENFVARWARLKRNSDPRYRPELPRNDPPADAIVSAGTDAISGPRANDEIDEPFDPATLPPIETITVDTDIRGFLQSRVPAELTRAALRQAWASDPAIRDFIGIAENQWDFNDPDAMPGFGPLRERDDLSALLAQAQGRYDELTGVISEMPVSIEPSLPTVADQEPLAVNQNAPREFGGLPPSDNIESSPHASRREGTVAGNAEAAEEVGSPRRRAHGGALPR